MNPSVVNIRVVQKLDGSSLQDGTFPFQLPDLPFDIPGYAGQRRAGPEPG